MKSGEIFKAIDRDDYNISTYKLKKDWTFTNMNYSTSGIQVDKLSKTDYLYKEIDHIYYTSQIYNLGEDKNINLELSDTGIISIGIPRIIYGEWIEPNTLKIKFNGNTLIDDGYGNLTDGSKHCGNIFYENGNAIIIDTGSLYSGWTTVPDDFEINFKGNHTIYEHEIICTIDKSEFNQTLNQTAYNPMTEASASAFAYASDNDWTPYITTIGLYDDKNNLLVTGKLARPIKNIKNMNLTFVIRFDV